METANEASRTPKNSVLKWLSLNLGFTISPFKVTTLVTNFSVFKATNGGERCHIAA